MTTPVESPEPQQPQWGPPPGCTPPPVDGYPATGWAPGPPKFSNGLGTTAIILGSISTFIAFLPGLFWIAWILGPLALVFGVIGYRNVRKGLADNKSSSLGGAVLGGVSMALAVVGLIVTVTMVKDAVHRDKEGRTTAVADEPSYVPDAPRTMPTFKELRNPVAVKFGESHTYDDGVTITVAAPTEYTPGKRVIGLEKGDRAFRVNITITNGSTDALNLDFAQPHAKDANGTDIYDILDTKAERKPFRGQLGPGEQAQGQYAFPVSADAAKMFQFSLNTGVFYRDAEWAGPLA
ncbi:DUF4352 domain-containing protein [Streptomyces violascens]|uniref:DUF4352 domain-containing protein n=1 Tax=Streptomyces violascens TaxID=67381 RepID=UPI0036472EDD